MLVEMKVNQFTSTLASLSPAPGGGSVAALAGALGAALGCMVTALTLKPGRKNPPQPDDVLELEKAAVELEQLRQTLLALVDEDTDAFNEYMAAIALPKITEEDKTVRRETMQVAMKHAFIVPLNTAKAAASVLPRLAQLAAIGNPQAISDVGVGALMVEAAVTGAIYNVRINAGSIKDEIFKEESLAEAITLLNDTKAQVQLILAAVELEI